jgi:hypothetical protein
MLNGTEWKSWPELKVKLTQLPFKVTTWDIYRLLERYSNIVKIDILEPVRYNAKTAFVTFR